jgi:hypothetical protein
MAALKGTMIMDVLILVCALAVSAPDCNKDTAEHVLRGPSVAQAAPPMTCMMEGMNFAAQSGLVGSDRYAKVVCSKPAPKRQAKLKSFDI